MYPSEPEQAKLSSRPMSEAAPSNLAAVQGLTVGHWTDSESATGCTVTLAPPGVMRAACAVRRRGDGDSRRIGGRRHRGDGRQGARSARRDERGRRDLGGPRGRRGGGRARSSQCRRERAGRERPGARGRPRRGRPVRRRARVPGPGRRPLRARGRGPEHDARGRGDECPARPRGVAGPGARGGGRARPAHRALRHAVRRRRRVRAQHRPGAGGHAAPGGSARRARGAGGGRAGGAPRARDARRPGTRGRQGVMNDRLERDIGDVARNWVPDTRLGVFEVAVQRGALAGCTTSRDAVAALRRIAAGAPLAAHFRLLPDSSVGDEQAAVVTAAAAPLVREPRVNADRVSEALHGETLEVLERRTDTWLRVRAADGYLAWVHPGYVALGTAAWAEDWAARASVRSLGADLRCQGERFRLAVGARAAPQRGGQVETADGRVWDVAAGALRPEVELRVEARLMAAPEWAPRWFSGAPYAV